MPFNLQVLGEFYSLNFSARLQSLLSEDGELSELTISESRAYIVGSHDLYMKEASEVELRCKIEESPGPPAYIYWYKVRIFVVKKVREVDLPDRTLFCLTQMHKTNVSGSQRHQLFLDGGYRSVPVHRGQQSRIDAHHQGAVTIHT